MSVKTRLDKLEAKQPPDDNLKNLSEEGWLAKIRQQQAELDLLGCPDCTDCADKKKCLEFYWKAKEQRKELGLD